MTEAIYIIIGLALGGVLAWLAASMRSRSAEGTIAELRAQVARAAEDFGTLRAGFDGEKERRVKAETKLTENTRYLEEQKAILEEARTRLTDAFKALSNDALKSNNEAFLQLARKSLDAVVAEARGDLGKRQEAIALYETVATAPLPNHFRVAAVHGAIAARRAEGKPKSE